jgi:uncharacterized protein (DUF697 family)
MLIDKFNTLFKVVDAAKNLNKKIDVKMNNRNLEELNENAEKIIRNHIVWSMGAGLIPIPIADFFAVSAIQLDMIRQLCRLYDVDFKETEGKALITALCGSGLARMGAEAVKFIPGVGSIIGGATMSILSGASTYALGEVFKKHFETGGTFLDFDVSRLRKQYEEKFEKGKRVARDIEREQEDQRKAAERQKAEEEVRRKLELEAEILKQKEKIVPNTKTLSDDTIDKLKELGNLRDLGIITQEEFDRMKKRLLEDF